MLKDKKKKKKEPHGCATDFELHLVSYEWPPKKSTLRFGITNITTAAQLKGAKTEGRGLVRNLLQ